MAVELYVNVYWQKYGDEETLAKHNMTVFFLLCTMQM